MAQQGYIFKQGGSWFVRYRADFTTDGQIVRKQKCVKLAEVCDRYRSKSDVEPLAETEMAKVKQSAKCSHPGILFTEYVKTIYLPYAQRTTKPSTYANRKTCIERYVLPRAKNLALRDFSTAIIYGILEDNTRDYSLNIGTVAKMRSMIHHIFVYATNTGAFTGKNPAEEVLIPEGATMPEPTHAATREEVQAILTALKSHRVARAAVAIMAFTGVRPGECRGLRWEEWDRAAKQIWVNRSVWHCKVTTPKTEKSVRPVTVDDQLRGILLDLWNANGCPISGYILGGTRKNKTGTKDHALNLDNLAKRVIRPALEKAELTWHGWYSLRRFLGTETRMHSKSTETSAKALGNTKEVADKHYVKATAVLPDVRRAVTRAVSGLVQ